MLYDAERNALRCSKDGRKSTVIYILFPLKQHKINIDKFNVLYLPVSADPPLTVMCVA